MFTLPAARNTPGPSTPAPITSPPFTDMVEMVACAPPLLSPSCPVIYVPPPARRHGAECDIVEVEVRGGSEGWGSLREMKGERGVKTSPFQRMPDMCLHFLPTFTINSFLTLRVARLHVNLHVSI